MGGGFVHRLGIVVSVAGAVWCASWAFATARRNRAARRRREALLGIARRPRAIRVRGWRAVLGHPALREGGLVAVAGLTAAVLVGGMAGAAAGPVVAYGTWRWRRRPRPDPNSHRVAGRLPLTAELLAACLAAGAGPVEAADAVGRAVGGPLGGALLRAAAELRLGGDPVECWSRFGSLLPQARPLGRWMARACSSGVPPVAVISRLAAEYRAGRAREAGSRARRAAVLATAPLGLCFLPAFLVIGVVPVLIGLAEGMTRAK